MQSLWKFVWKLLKKLKLELPYDLYTTQVHTRRTLSQYTTDPCTFMLIFTLITMGNVTNLDVYEQMNG